uniref:tRNA (guanine-N(1)-)-methyltransferase n=1 Tax=candidate division WOR-3 bacterium TaxID=2052148 RepID=A0A7C4GBW0_UNCW3
MRISIVTLFPDYFRGPFECGPTRIAREKQALALDYVNPRDFTEDAHHTVDDQPFGGGAGMILKPEPLFRAVESVREDDASVVLLSPQGRRLDQPLAHELSREKHLILVCGRYKGVDERVRLLLADRELSIGDYVLAGGEAAAVVVVEAVARLLPGAVGDEDSVAGDSFTASLLDSPWYTRPREFRGASVPDVLVSGDHSAVGRWRREQSLLATARRRPELLRQTVLTESEREFLLAQLGKELPDGKEEKN